MISSCSSNAGFNLYVRLLDVHVQTNGIELTEKDPTLQLEAMAEQYAWLEATRASVTGHIIKKKKKGGILQVYGPFLYGLFYDQKKKKFGRA